MANEDSDAHIQREVNALVGKLERACKPCPVCLKKIIETEMVTNPKLEWGGAITRDALNKFDFVAQSAYRSIENEIIHDLTKLGKPAVPILREVLESKDGHVAAIIAKVLGNIGDKSAVPTLIKIMQDEGKQFDARLSCAISLSHFNEPSAIPVLVSGLRITSELIVIERTVRAEFSKFELQDAINLRLLRNETSSFRKLCLVALMEAMNHKQKIKRESSLECLKTTRFWEKRWRDFTGADSSKVMNPFIFKTLYLDPWGNEVWIKRSSNGEVKREALQDQILLMGIRKYIHKFGKGKPLKNMMAQLASFNCGINPYPAGLSDSNKYSFKGFVKIGDKILNYKYEKDSDRWVYSGLVWVGVPSNKSIIPDDQ